MRTYRYEVEGGPPVYAGGGWRGKWVAWRGVAWTDCNGRQASTATTNDLSLDKELVVVMVDPAQIPVPAQGFGLFPSEATESGFSVSPDEMPYRVDGDGAGQ